MAGFDSVCQTSQHAAVTTLHARRTTTSNWRFKKRKEKEEKSKSRSNEVFLIITMHVFGAFSKSLCLTWKGVLLLVRLVDLFYISILEKAFTDPMEMRHNGRNYGR